AIDRDEAGEKDIYKIDQLQAMKWIKIAWSEVSAEMIRRCWFRTKIVSPRDENGIPVIPPIAVESINNVEDEFVVPPLTGEEQLIILRSALRIVDERIDDGGVTMKTLRKLQTCIREEIRKEKVGKQVQQKLEQYFQA
ncbi:164_t:CDS:2, partial [Dentiscutata heterogama]